MAELLIVIVEGPSAGRETGLEGTLTMGRDPAAGVVLDDAEASREHASITARPGGGAVVDDLGSTNGTFVNEERIEVTRELVAGDRIRIGTTVMEVRTVTVTAPAAAAAAAPGPEAAPGAVPGPEAAAPPRPPPGQVPAAEGPLAPYFPESAADYPVQVDFDYPEGGIARWRPFVQWWLLVIPQFIAFFFAAIAAYIVLFIAFFAVLITGRYPPGLFNFLAGFGRWAARLSGYYYLMTERYPPFSLGEHPEYPVRARFEYPEAGIARWRPLVQWILIIPYAIVTYALGTVAFLGAVAAGIVIIFTGRYPRPIFDLIAAYIRWQTRQNAYAAFMTDRYPPFTLTS